MDLSFFRQSEMGFAGRSAARLDYGVLIASLSALQSASAAARAVRGCGAAARAFVRGEAAVELILGGSGWREAIEAQGGSFHRGQASLAGKTA